MMGDSLWMWGPRSLVTRRPRLRALRAANPVQALLRLGHPPPHLAHERVALLVREARGGDGLQEVDVDVVGADPDVALPLHLPRAVQDHGHDGNLRGDRE